MRDKDRDFEWVKRAAKGEENACREIFNKYFVEIVGMLRSRGFSWVDAEEIASHTLADAFRSFRSREFETLNLRAFLRKIAERRSFDFMNAVGSRRRSWEGRVLESSRETKSGSYELGDSAQEWEAMRIRVVEVWEELDPEEAELLTNLFVKKESAEEVGRRTGKSAYLVKKSLSALLERVRDMMRGRG